MSGADSILSWAQGGGDKAKAKYPYPVGMLDAVLSVVPFSDEMVGAGAGVAALARGQDPAKAYSERKGQYEQAVQDYIAQNPVRGRAGQALGLVGTVGANTGISGAQTGMQMLKEGAKTGAVLGGVTGLSEGDGMGERLANAGMGLLTGGAIGAAVPLAVSGGQKMLSAVTAPFTSPQTRADRLAAQALAREGVYTAEQGMAAMAPFKDKPGMLADIGPNTMGRLRAAASQPGPGQTVAVQSMRDRGAAQSDRILQDIADTFDNQGTAYSALRRLDQEKRVAAEPLYKQAFGDDGGVMLGDDALLYVSDIAERPFAKTAWAKARRSLANEGIALPDTIEEAVRQGITYKQIDVFKQMVDDQIGVLMRSGKTNEARRLIGAKNDMLAVLDDANPAYAAARKAYGGPAGAQEAIEDGQKVFSMSPEQVADTIANLPVDHQAYFRLGVAQAMRDKVSRIGDSRNITGSFLSSPGDRAKIEAAFESEAQFAEFMRRLQAERTMAGTEREILNQSRTGEKLAEQAEVDGVAANPLGAAFSEIYTPLRQGNLLGAAGAAGRNAIEVLREQVGPATRGRLAEIFAATDPAEVAATLSRLEARGAIDAADATKIRSVLKSLSGMSAVGANQ